MRTDSNTFSVSVIAPTLAPPPGYFQDVSLNTLADVDPCPQRNCVYSGVQGQESVFRVWNGGAFSPYYSALGALVVHGGGHNAYGGNECYAFDLSTRMWVRVGAPSPYNGANGSPDVVDGLYPDGQPMPPHTYDGVFILPPGLGGGPKGSFVRCGHAGATFPQRAWAMPLTTGPNTSAAWQQKVSGFPVGVNYASVALDEARHRAYVLSSASGGGCCAIDLDLWTAAALLGSGGGGDGPVNSVMAYCPPLDLLVYCARHNDFSGGPYHNRLKARVIGSGGNVAWTVLNSDPDAGMLALNKSVNWGLEWSPAGGYFVCYPGRGSTSVWKLHPPAANPLVDEWLWEEVVMTGLSGATPPFVLDGGGYNGHWSRFREVPALSTPGSPCFIFADGRSQPVQLWRL